MIFLGHLGIGAALTKPIRQRLSLGWILFGTIASDVLDKSLYYGLVLITGRTGAELGLISGTRTFGHTGLFVVTLSILALSFKSKRLAALSAGMATHLLLDGVTDHFNTLKTGVSYESALMWPLTGSSFPVSPFHSVFEHMASWNYSFLIAAEIIGASFLAWEFWKKNNI